MKDVRWLQRFMNFEKAFLNLKEAKDRVTDDWLLAAGVIQTFEFTFELGWKTLKDFLILNGEEVKFPREVIKTAFQRELIIDGHVWIAMLEKRNELAHTYNDQQAKAAVELIKVTYFPVIEQLYSVLKEKRENSL